ncbi:MFS transporter [Sphingomonas sp. ASV193]|uniref:MFS transporter n=1 Tax=Sphingomonas sp. ASV193 TaxID=3144405 RepID=UPI0032E8663A
MSRAGQRLAFWTVAALFFAWGFVTANNDPLLVALKTAFTLSYSQALLTQIVFFLAYGLLSLPAAWLSARIGPADAIIGSLAVMAAGCAAVALGTGAGGYGPILAALFVIAAGFTALQVAANPLAAELGDAKGRHFRLNLAQALNSLGVVLGVHFGSRLMLGGSPDVAGAASRAALLGAVASAFWTMAAMLGALLLLFALLRRRIAATAPVQPVPAGMFDALRSRWAIAGAVAIGLYVGAEVSIGSILINFLGQPSILGVSAAAAGALAANLYWGGALVGRIVGTALLTRLAAAPLLAGCGVAAAALSLVVLVADGPVAGYAALAIGLANSIMFPTIFSLTLERSGVAQSATSGLLCLAIFGGALLPWTVGRIADRLGLGASFAVPLAAYLVIVAFALAANRRKESPC